MRGGYTSVDTLSLEWGQGYSEPADEPLAPLPVLARVPEVATPAQPQPATQQPPAPKANFSSLPASVIEVASTVAPTPPSTPTPPIGVEPTEPVRHPELPETDLDDGAGEPAGSGRVATRRIDTLAAPTEPDAIEPGGAQPQAIQPPSTGEDWITALLRVDEVLARHSQVIVLLTLLAAAGLTIALLRGEPVTIDGGSGSPPSAPLQPAFSLLPPEEVPTNRPDYEAKAPGGGTQLAIRATGPISARRPTDAIAANPTIETPSDPSGPPQARLSRVVLPTEQGSTR